MKRFSLGIATVALLMFAAGTSAQLAEIPAGVPSIKAANGPAVRVDLNGDGRKERVSLQEPQQKRYNRDHRPFRIRVNGQVFNDVFTDSNVPGIGDEMPLSLEFRALSRHSRRRYLFLGGPTGYEATAYKIYEWRNGRIRTVQSEAMMIDSIGTNGTVNEGFGYNAWAYTRFPWRLNRQGMLQIVPSVNPIYDTSTGKRNVRVHRLEEAIRFHQSPQASSPLFTVPKGASLIFDGIDTHRWIRARFGRKTGWLPGKTIDESKSFHFPRAG